MSAPFRVLVTGDNLAPAAVKILTDIGADVVLMQGAITPERLIAEMAPSPTQAIMMRGNPVISAAVIAGNPHLQVIAKHGAGVDSVDIDAATSRRVPVMVAGDANAPAVAEHAIGLILALGRDIVSLDARTRTGAWERATMLPEQQGIDLRRMATGPSPGDVQPDTSCPKVMPSNGIRDGVGTP